MSIPMKSKSEADEKLQIFCKNIGIPNEFYMDNAPKMTGLKSFYQMVCNEKIINLFDNRTTLFMAEKM